MVGRGLKGARKMHKNCKKLQKNARKCGFLQEIGQKNGKIRKNEKKFTRVFLMQGSVVRDGGQGFPRRLSRPNSL